MQLPPAIEQALAPLVERLPLSESMPELVVTQPAAPDILACATAVVNDPAIHANPALAAGVWLYVDDLNRSHALSQGLHDATGSFWHGIMHRREGDFSNSHYWLRKAGAHPAVAALEGYDSHAFVDAVADGGGADMVDLQRREWAALFTWCARQ